MLLKAGFCGQFFSYFLYFIVVAIIELIGPVGGYCAHDFSRDGSTKALC